MTDTHSPEKAHFLTGDKVFLADGPYQGTGGTFVGLQEDGNWASIAQENGRTWIHPVVWLRHGSFTPLNVPGDARPN